MAREAREGTAAQEVREGVEEAFGFGGPHTLGGEVHQGRAQGFQGRDGAAGRRGSSIDGLPQSFPRLFGCITPPTPYSSGARCPLKRSIPQRLIVVYCVSHIFLHSAFF